MPESRDYAAYLATLNSAKFRALWPNQNHVLAEYSSHFSGKRDVAIELPTGAGKTLIALLVAGAWLSEGRKVAVLSANKTLARQMAAEAKQLGIPAAYMEGRGEDIPIATRRAYQRAHSVGIMNYWVYFNQNPVVDQADLLVMDDAHLAEHCLHSLYSLEITKHRHQEPFRAIAAELNSRFPDYSVLADALSDDAPPSTTADLLSFIDQAEVAQRIQEILDGYVSGGADIDFKFRWSRLRPKVRITNLYISQQSFWLRPYVYPLVANLHYTGVQQTLYMSATIGDPGDLSRRLGVRPIQKIPVPPTFAETTSGRRLVVMNRTDDKTDIPARVARALLAAIRLHPKSLWLCSSEAEATKMRQAVIAWLDANNVPGHPTWLLTSLGDEVDQFRAAPAGHLFVAGRFDGMDFKGDECRIVVVRKLPRAINLQEEFITTYLRDSGFMRRRLNQRIVQALGRCNRGPDDYGIYFLVDQRFATHFSRDANREGLGANVMGEIDLAQDLAEKDEAGLVDFVREFLQGDFSSYDTALSALAAGLPPPRGTESTPDTSDLEVTGWAAMDSENYPVAGASFEGCWDKAKQANLLEIAALHGWHRAKALYLEGCQGDAARTERSLRVLDEAIRRGGQSSWFNRQRAALARARADAEVAGAVTEAEYAEAVVRSFDDLLEKVGTAGLRYQRYIDTLTRKLVSTSHAEFQEALELLGELLGFSAARPTHGTATDCRWRGEFGNAREVFTFEAKIEDNPSGKITATDLGQAHNQRERANGEYAWRGYTVRGTIVTHLEAIHDDAVSSVGPTAIVRKAAIVALWDQLRVLLSEYRDSWSADDVSVRIQAAGRLRPRIPKTGWLVRALDSATPFVDAAAFLQEWLAH